MRHVKKRATFKRTAAYRYAVELVKRLVKEGHQAFLVGGCVRDLLMGRSPKDFDIATGAKPEEVARLFPKVIPVGAQFGVQIVLKGPHAYEVATFRTDLAYKDGRRPEGVVFSTPEQDALRRDFTVNGLFFDPLKGKVIDYVGGQIDLRKKLIRAIGDPAHRFREDRLRMLRAVRFAAVLGFEIDGPTFQAVRKAANEITDVSSERIRDELTKLFSGPHPARALDLLDESGLLDVILPEVSRMKGVPQPPEFHPEGDVYVHTRLLLSYLKSPSVLLAFGGLLHDIGKPATYRVAERIRFDGHDKVGAAMAKRICKRLRFSNVETEEISDLVGEHMRFKDVRKMKVSTLKRFMGISVFEEHLKLHRADCLASHKDLSNWWFLRAKLKEFSREEIKPRPLINGHDLLQRGYAEGPRLGIILKAVEERQLEGELTAFDQAISWVQKEFPLAQQGRVE